MSYFSLHFNSVYLKIQVSQSSETRKIFLDVNSLTCTWTSSYGELIVIVTRKQFIFCHLNLKAHTCILPREIAHANRFLTRNIFSLDAVQNYFRYALHYFYKYVIYAFTKLKKGQIARKNKTILKY